MGRLGVRVVLSATHPYLGPRAGASIRSAWARQRAVLSAADHGAGRRPIWTTAFEARCTDG